jgi:hypothetical protein
MKARKYPSWVLLSTDIHRIARAHGHHLSRVEEIVIAGRFSEAIGIELEHWEDVLATIIAREKGCDSDDGVNVIAQAAQRGPIG